MVEGCVDDTWLDALGDFRAERDFAGAAVEGDEIPVIDAAIFGVERMDFEHVLGMPDIIVGAAGLRADIVLRQDAARGEEEREARALLFLCGDVFRDHELAFAADEAVNVHDRCAKWGIVIAWPLDGAELLDFCVADTLEGRGEAGDFVHDLGRVVVVHLVAEGCGEIDGCLPFGLARFRLHDLADAADAALGIGEGAILLQEGRTRQEDMGVFGGLVQEEILNDHAFHGFEAGGDVFGVRVGLGDVLALNIDTLEIAANGFVEHVRDAEALFV